MYKKSLLLAGFVVVLLLASLAIFSSAGKVDTYQNCTETMEDCCSKQKDATPSGEMIWESLPSRFFSSFGF